MWCHSIVFTQKALELKMHNEQMMISNNSNFHTHDAHFHTFYCYTQRFYSAKINLSKAKTEKFAVSLHLTQKWCRKRIQALFNVYMSLSFNMSNMSKVYSVSGFWYILATKNWIMIKIIHFYVDLCGLS